MSAQRYGGQARSQTTCKCAHQDCKFAAASLNPPSPARSLPNSIVIPSSDFSEEVTNPCAAHPERPLGLSRELYYVSPPAPQACDWATSLEPLGGTNARHWLAAVIESSSVAQAPKNGRKRPLTNCTPPCTPPFLPSACPFQNPDVA